MNTSTIKLHNNLSLLLLTHNESKNLERNFTWLKTCPAIKEIIIVDDNSTDNTLEIIKKLESKHRQVKILKHSLNNNFASQRNFGISQAKYNWIFSLDADEQPSKKLIRFLNHFDKDQYKSYSFKRQDIFLGKPLSHGENAFLNFTRLVHKKYGQFTGQVHEVWDTKKDIKKTDLSIKHYSHQTIKSFIQKINFYTDIRSQEMYSQGIKVNIYQIIFFPIGKFIEDYFLKLGFLDGTAGIIMALCMSFHVFLNKAKLWHLYRQ
ncbi:MAG: glycosyltransferase family 2 protein [Candidatus Shapirobacteria bacterium]|nr:glycosyltransferase family 2 protein [Candidatus Shapirobacteria bacterium]